MDLPVRRRAVSRKLRGGDLGGSSARSPENGSGDAPAVTLIEGSARDFIGEADFVLTNPYAPFPQCLVGLPMLIANFTKRKALCEDYVRSDLVEVSPWGRDSRCMIWVANAPLIKVDCSDLIEEEEIPGRGWFPLELPLRLLRAYVERPAIVCDPFMGRGTVGKAARMLGHRFIGIDIQPERVALARAYVNT